MVLAREIAGGSDAWRFLARGAGVGHNSGGRKSMYAIIFDLDTSALQLAYPNPSWNNAYADIRGFLTARGFEWVQGSGYFGDDSVDAVKCVLTIQRLSRKFPWFKAAVRDIRMLRIEENNDLLPTIMDDGDE
ncbi:virulence factor [Novosphingobium sp.]|uniref:virulence factor n=1 Tax=Novosphingobium sp. TaxID=1874826 RepID=UPI002600260B|nr:virulence factor [Novosphingobium sp.]